MADNHNSRSQVSLAKHIRDIIILPFTVTVIVPYLVYNPKQTLLKASTIIQITGGLFLTAGLCLFLYTFYLFRNFGKGTLAPWEPTQKLIILGPYKYCRNPMITGVLFILVGEALVLNSRPILTWAGTFFLINTLYFIVLEEPALYKRFGDDYKKYKENVPRWIPRLKAYKKDQ